MKKESIDILASLMRNRQTQLPARFRPFTTERESLPSAVVVTGPRGCGKSTFLLYHASKRNMLYMSADNPLVAGESFFETASDVFMQGYDGIIVDEVHHLKDWSVQLKAVYDSFPAKAVWASDSSSLVLRKGNADLSRRFLPIQMPIMSFREFLFLETGRVCGRYNLGDATPPVEPDSEMLRLFQEYRAHGTCPYYAEGNYAERAISVLNKTLHSDIPFFVPAITDMNLRLMGAVVGMLAASHIPRVNITNLCSDWGIGAEKLYNLLSVMESVGILRIIKPENDKKSQSVGAKMFFSDPTLYNVLKGDAGTEREAYVASCFANAGWNVAASRDEKKGDFTLTRGFAGEKLLVEIGGKKKSSKSSDFVIRDNIDQPTKNAIPFWLVGMMW